MKRFNKEKIKLPTRIIITGKSNTGKSIYAKTLIYYLADNIDKLIIISPTFEDSPFKDIEGDISINYEYDPEIIRDIIEDQKNKLNNDEELEEIVILFDDCILDINKSDKYFESLFTRARHYRISPIVITQKLRNISPTCRYNVDYVCCTKIYNSLEKDIIYSEYGNVDKRNFFKILDKCTDNYNLLIINNTTANAKEILSYDRGFLRLPEFYI